MKTFLLILSVVLCTAVSSAQKINAAKVPASVNSNFNAKFPNASKVKWEKEKENYEASFVVNQSEQSALLNSVGELIETEIEITNKELPKNVLPYVASKYPGKKISETSKITSAQGLITFEVEIKGKDLIFDNNGFLIKEIIP
jgi:Tfp pilus assembly protein PilX